MLQLLGFIIDCPDPMKLEAFYSQVTVERHVIPLG
jgi:hypothetical protein